MLLRARRERPRGRRAAEQRDELATPHHVWMAPAWQEITSRAAQKALAVMCPACSRSPGGLLALMESANRGLITRGDRCPNEAAGSLGSVGSTDCAITRHYSLASSSAGWGGLSRHSPGPVFLLAQHHRPGDARRLVANAPGEPDLFQKKFGPATDAGADEFCAINTGA
jgi:hypothetical protein